MQASSGRLQTGTICDGKSDKKFPSVAMMKGSKNFFMLPTNEISLDLYRQKCCGKYSWARMPWERVWGVWGKVPQNTPSGGENRCEYGDFLVGLGGLAAQNHSSWLT